MVAHGLGALVVSGDHCIQVVSYCPDDLELYIRGE